MKKVVFKRKLKSVFVDENGNETFHVPFGKEYPLKDGTGIEIDVHGLFIDWGLDSDERMGSWTIAIVQLQDGSIQYVHPVIEKLIFVQQSSAKEKTIKSLTPTMKEFFEALQNASAVHKVVFYNTTAEYQARIDFHEDGLLGNDFEVFQDNGLNLVEFLKNL